MIGPHPRAFLLILLVCHAYAILTNPSSRTFVASLSGSALLSTLLSPCNPPYSASDLCGNGSTSSCHEH